MYVCMYVCMYIYILISSRASITPVLWLVGLKAENH